MTITLLGAIFAPLTLLCILLRKREWLPFLLATSMPFSSVNAVIVGASTIAPFYLVAVAALVFVTTDFFRPRMEQRPLKLYGLALGLMVFVTLITLTLPRVFAGQPVLIPRDGIDGGVHDPGALTFSISNVAQLGYLLLGLSVVVFFANNRPKNLHFLNAGFILGTLLNLWALTDIAWPYSVFDSSERGISDRALGGVAGRFRGFFPEPSYLALFCLPAVAYNLFLLRARARRWVKTGRLALVIANLAVIYFSESGTAVLSILIIAGLMALYFCARAIRRLTTFVPLPVLLAGHGVLVGIFLGWSRISGYFVGVIEGKTSSGSFANRSAADQLSWEILRDTFGLGVGLGSSRPSSFFAMLASNLGVIGTVLFVAFVATLVVRAVRCDRYAPQVWALVAVLVAKVVAEPNMSLPVMWALLGACAVSFTETKARSVEQIDAGLGGLDRRGRHAPRFKRPSSHPARVLDHRELVADHPPPGTPRSGAGPRRARRTEHAR